MNRFGKVLAVLAVGILAGCEALLIPEEDPNEAFAEVAEQVAAALGDQVRSFVIVDLSVAEVVRGFNAGEVRLPFRDRDGNVVELSYPGRQFRLRAPGVTTGGLRSGPVRNPSVRTVVLPREQNYSFGNCITLADRPQGEFEACGALTVMDEAQTMLQAMVLSSRLGLAIIEPVDLVIGGRGNPNLHIVYNAVDTPPRRLLAGRGAGRPGYPRV